MTSNGGIWPDDDLPREWCPDCEQDRLIDEESTEGVWTRHGEEMFTVLRLSCGHAVSFQEL